MPDGLIIEDERLVGLRFRRTKIENGRVVPQEETFERRGAYVISSIGSIPEPIEGIPMKGELFAFSHWELGRLDDYPTVFSAGNVVTGKGNIVSSRKHARAVTQTVIESFLGLSEDGHAGEGALADAMRDAANERGHGIAADLRTQPPITAEALAEIRRRVAERQAAVGYAGDLASWLEKVTPPDFA